MKELGAMSQGKRSRKLDLTSWNLPAEVTDYYKRHGVEQMFPWQAQCLLTGAALQGGNLLYSAPTSAGKTLVAEILALKRILKTKRKGIFILPFVSVAREKMFALRALYSGLGLTVGGFMGAQTPAGGFKRVDVAVCTIERANSLINRLLEAGKLSQLAVIIVDELHMVGDSSRGCLIEPLLTKVNFHVKTEREDTSNDSVQIIGMSATLPNMHVLSTWLNADLYCTDFRPVPLTEYVKIGSSILNTDMKHVRDVQTPGCYDNDAEQISNLCLETIKEKRSVLIFCPSKDWCERLCKTIAKAFYMIMAGKAECPDALRESVTEAINKEKILGLLEQLKQTSVGLSEQLRTTISYTVAFHHAGLTLEEKDVIEAGFRSSVIRVLVATTTLSSGVNLPAQRVIIRSPLFMGKPMSVLTYKQMVGRAGRKGIDTFGESILICKPTERDVVKDLINSDLPPATSQLVRRDGDGGYILRPGVRRALLEMVASSTAKSEETLKLYMSCTLLAAEVADDDCIGQLVTECIHSLEENEFITITESSDNGGSPLITPTQLGQAVFASSMNPDDSLTILSDLNKARKQFVLENELHMVYQVTPINALHDNIDWMRYLDLWESLPSDQKRVGELVGVSERFIALSHQGRRRRNNESQQRSLQIHRRFYTALVLHDIVNELPLAAVERKYGVNKGAVQALQQNAAIFAGMICTFCDRLGWTPLKLLLSDFQPRLDTGVRRELVDLVRLTSLDAKKARHFYNSGLHTVGELVQSSLEDISRLLATFLPFESGKQDFGETEWDVKERTARRLTLGVSKQPLTLMEATQLILEEAQMIFQQDLELLGAKANVNKNTSCSTPSPLSVSHITPEDRPAGTQLEKSFSEASSQSLSSLSLHSPVKDKQPSLGAHLDSCGPLHQPTSAQEPTPRKYFRQQSKPLRLGERKLMGPADETVVSDSQGSSTSFNYRSLLDQVEHHIRSSPPSPLNKPTSATSHSGSSHSDRNSIVRGQPEAGGAVSSSEEVKDSDSRVSADASLLDGENSSVMWGDSFMFPSQCSQTASSPQQRVNSSQGSDLGSSLQQQFGSTPEVRVEQNSSQDSAEHAGTLEMADTSWQSRTLKRLRVSPDLTYTRLKKRKRIRTSTISRRKLCSQQSNSDLDLCNSEQPQCSPVAASKVSESAVAWSLNDSSLLAGEQTPEGVTPSCCDTTTGSNDLFSKSMDSLVWSPLSEMGHVTTENASLNKQQLTSDAGACVSPVFPLQSPGKLHTANKVDIVDVTDWQQTSQVEEESIGFHNSVDSTKCKGDEGVSEASTSTLLSPAGMALHQYGVVVVGLAVTLGCTVFYMDLASDVNHKLKLISKVLSLDLSTKVIFDSKEQSKRLASMLGRPLSLQRVVDPKLAVWLLEPADRELSLLGVVHKAAPWLSDVISTNIGACIGTGSVGLRPEATASPRLRACYESLSMMAVHKPLLSMLEEKGLRPAFEEIEMPHLACLAAMESHGLGFDVEELARQSETIMNCLKLVEKNSLSYAKRPFDLNSAKDVGEVLFVELRLPYERKKVVKRRGAPWSTAQHQLEKIKSLHPLPALVLLWRKLHLALKTLVQPLMDRKVWCEQVSMYRIYSICSIHTATGRITMNEPNLQTICKDISLEIADIPQLAGKVVSLRNAFTSAPGYVLLSADYSQLELRIISHLASDPTLLSLLNGGGDVFRDIASRWKSVPIDSVTAEQRQHAKQICYGIIYGMGTKALAEQLNVDESSAEQLMADFQNTFLGLKKYISSTVEACRASGYVTTIAGRRRYLPLINSLNNRAGRSQAERQAVNTTVQGSAADLVKLATVRLHTTLGQGVRLVLQVHDELVYEVPLALVPSTAAQVKHVMETVGRELKLDVTMSVRVKTGTTWAQLQEMAVT